METGSSGEVVDIAMASVDRCIHRDDDYIEGALFSDGNTRAELDEYAVSLGLDPEDKFHTNRMDWNFDHFSTIERDVTIYRLYNTTAGCVTTNPYLLIWGDWEVTKYR